jgi:anti-sigma regulatory factor (Ser/Thr protein kinase)
LTFFLIPIAFAAAVLGARGGLLLTAVSLIVARFLMVETNASGWRLDVSDLVDYSGLAIGSILISVVVGRLRSSLDDVRRMHDTLIETDRRLLESEERRIAANREVLLAVTGSRLVVCDFREFREMVVGEKLLSLTVSSAQDISNGRSTLRGAVQERGLISRRIYDFEACTTEAATNALEHAGSGLVELYVDGEDVLVVVSDNGPGIAPGDLARATLEKGFSTRVSLGMGFKMMWELADLLAVCTSEGGTRILIRINEHSNNDFEQSLLSRYPALDV